MVLGMRAQAKGNSINVAKGHKQETIKIRKINEAKGKAQGIALIAQAINMPGGRDSLNLRVAEQYVGEFGKLAKPSTAMIIPSNMSGMVTSFGNLLERGKSGAGP